MINNGMNHLIYGNATYEVPLSLDLIKDKVLDAMQSEETVAVELPYINYHLVTGTAIFFINKNTPITLLGKLE